MVKNFGFDGLECSILTPTVLTDRVGFYKHFIQMLNVDMGNSVYCDRMAHY
ncbi:glycoside hydrolase family 19 protein [Nostoc sp.]|uniref:glycoside hydrolase family 19 protein n=1 Tax=Nostoc sp. TaxID=1180 RepID=UPI002FF6715D